MEEVIEQPSEYEMERGKPMPNLIHGIIQANLSFEFKSRYRNQFHIASEVALATLPIGTTPDLVLYPLFELDYQNQPAKRTDAPLLTIEIQSPSQSPEEMIEKTNIYFEFGVKSCWIVFPSLKAIAVFDRPNHFEFYHNEDTVIDSQFHLELPLSGVFS
jgi:Uma2 family endonuclease